MQEGFPSGLGEMDSRVSGRSYKTQHCSRGRIRVPETLGGLIYLVIIASLTNTGGVSKTGGRTWDEIRLVCS